MRNLLLCLTLASALTALVSADFVKTATVGHVGVEDDANGSVSVNAGVSFLGLPRLSGRAVRVALFFSSVTLTSSDSLSSATVQFTAAASSSNSSNSSNSSSSSDLPGNCTLLVRAQGAVSPASPQAVQGDLSARPLTQASVVWTPSEWAVAGERGAAQRTPDLRPLLTEVMALPGWTSGSPMVLIFTLHPNDTSPSANTTRLAEALAADLASRPELSVTVSGNDPGNSGGGGFVVPGVSEASSLFEDFGLYPSIAVLVAAVASIGLLIFCCRRRVLLARASRRTWEIYPKYIQTGAVLGVGRFGKVYLGSLKSGQRNSRAQILQEEALRAMEEQQPEAGSGQLDKNTRQAAIYECDFSLITRREGRTFKAEVDVMKVFSLPPHRNVRRLLGTVHLKTVHMYLLEYCSQGSLRDFLVAYDGTLRTTTRIRMAQDVCCGMEFLSSKSYIHRFLSAGHCMVDEAGTVKIASIGRYLHVNGAAKGKEQIATLPIRWMAPESLVYGRFSNASDVYSFGILIWEILHDGQEPYSGLMNEQVIERVIANGRPTCEDSPTDSMKKIMKMAWHSSEALRPDFTALSGLLKSCALEHKNEDAAAEQQQQQQRRVRSASNATTSTTGRPIASPAKRMTSRESSTHSTISALHGGRKGPAPPPPAPSTQRGRLQSMGGSSLGSVQMEIISLPHGESGSRDYHHRLPSNASSTTSIAASRRQTMPLPPLPSGESEDSPAVSNRRRSSANSTRLPPPPPYPLEPLEIEVETTFVNKAITISADENGEHKIKVDDSSHLYDVARELLKNAPPPPPMLPLASLPAPPLTTEAPRSPASARRDVPALPTLHEQIYQNHEGLEQEQQQQHQHQQQEHDEQSEGRRRTMSQNSLDSVAETDAYSHVAAHRRQTGSGMAFSKKAKSKTSIKSRRSSNTSQVAIDVDAVLQAELDDLPPPLPPKPQTLRLRSESYENLDWDPAGLPPSRRNSGDFV